MSGVAAVVSLRAITAACCSLALGSAPILRQVAAPGLGDSMLGLVNKGGTPGARDFDPQTVADRRSQRFIAGGIRNAFPAVRIVGEEGDLGSNEEDEAVVKKAMMENKIDLSCLDKKWPTSKDTMLPADEVCVWIDPLDGTREFTEGKFEFVSTLVGVTWKGKAVAGVISEPYYYDYNERPEGFTDSARAMWGCPLGDVGAHIYGQDDWKPSTPDEARCLVTTSRSRTQGPVVDTMQRLGDRVTQHVQAGGSGHKLSRVIEGSADIWLYPAAGTSRWDTCPGDALLQAIGGHCTNALGKPIVYDADASYDNTEGVIAARRKDFWDATVEAAAPSMAEQQAARK